MADAPQTEPAESAVPVTGGGRRRWPFHLAVAFAFLFVASTAALLALTRTQPGHDFALGLLLDQAKQRLNAELTVTGIRSGGLIAGATLTGVSIAEPGRSPSLTADSIRARYSLWGLLRGQLVFAGLELWAPRVVVEQLPDEGEVNWTRILAGIGQVAEPPAGTEASGEPVIEGASGSTGDEGVSSLPAPPEPSAPPRITLRNISVIGGEVVVRLPASRPPVADRRARYVEAPEGAGHLREQLFGDINGQLAELSVGGGSAIDVIDVGSLALEGHVLEQPFTIQDFRGVITLTEGEMAFDADRLWLPEMETFGTGTVTWKDGVPELDAHLTALTLRSESLRWIEPRLPSASGGFELGVQMRDGRTELAFSALDLRTGDGQVRGRLTVTLGRGLPILDGDLETQTLDLSFLDNWLERPVPWSGRLTGRLQVRGTPEDLMLAGQFVATDAFGLRPATEFEIDGILHLGEAPGLTDFMLYSSPFYYGLAGELDERITIRGPGFVRVEADGRMATGIRFSTSLAHYPAALPASEITAEGVVAGFGDQLRVDVDGQLAPLSFTTLRRYYPELELTGEASGRVRVQGPMSDLSVDTELETPAGPLVARARFDGRNPGRSYSVEGEVQNFLVSRIMPALPEPTRVSGSAFVNGRGIRRDSVEAFVRASVTAASIGTIRVDSAQSSFRLAAGVITLDTLRVATNVGTLDAVGTLGLADGLPPGEIRVDLVSQSIAGIRPFFMGDSIIAADTLSPLELEFLRAQGVDPDTLPLSRDVALDGSLTASAILRGSVDNFTAEGIGRIERARYGPNFLAAADLSYRVDALPTLDGPIVTTVTADSFLVLDRRFTGGTLDLELTGSIGRVSALLDRSGGGSYQTRTTFQVDSLGGVLNVDDLTIRFADDRWSLGGPTSVSWNAGRFEVRDFSLIRPGVDGMRIEADGTIPRGSGPADFDLEIRALPLERLMRAAQIQSDLRGLVGLTLNVAGSADAPVMQGSLDARDLEYQSLRFSRIQGVLEYSDRQLSGDVEAWQGETRVMTAVGGLPADLTLGEVPTRFPDEPMDVRVGMTSFPAAAIMGFLESFERVEGTLEGDVHFAGTPDDLSPEGTIRLQGGAADLPALGVRHEEVEATFELTPDASVDVVASLRSGGQAQVTGSVLLRPVRDPTFDLTIEAQGFQAANRRDITGVVSGQLLLTQSFLRPAVEGQVNVEQGTLSLDELARYSTIVDLSDTTFFASVDTSLIAVRPVIEASQNPFLQHLRADVDLRVLRDTWLRSRQIDIEIGGELQVLYDRSTRDFVALGELEAVRGSYRRFGRRFEVEEGTLEFLGIPGVNPNLDIQAVARVRTGDVPLNIIANVGGTLVTPVVSLTSDATTPIEEPELISYLVWGRPSALLGSGESSVLRGATEAGFTLGLGTLANELGSAVAQEIGFVDYFAITQSQAAQQVGADVTLRGTLASTQIEIGRYFWDDVFLAFVLRPVGGAGQSQNRLPGARLEWRFTDQWGVEGFWEDRLLRQGVLAAQESSLSLAQSLGLFVYREWGR